MITKDKKTIDIEETRKHLKKLKAEPLIEMILTNYENHNIYIVLNFYKKESLCKFSWIDLDLVEGNDIEKYINYQLVPKKYIEYLIEFFEDKNIFKKYIVEENNNDGRVELNITVTDDEYNYIFSKYLPLKLEFLVTIIQTIFDHLPKMLEVFLFQILSSFYGTQWRYEYKKTFDFDLFSDDIDKLFEEQIIYRGNNYFNNHKVKFLEKIDDRYFAVVNGTKDEDKYVVIIDYNHEEQKMNVFCNCPCEFYCKHIYAVLKCIQNDIYNRFFKIMYKKSNVNLYERVVNFDYLLCLGTVESNFEVINRNGLIELIPILDRNWEVLEDDENRTLSKAINQIYIEEKILK